MSVEQIKMIIGYSQKSIKRLEGLIQKDGEKHEEYVREQQRLNYLVDYYTLVLRRSGFIRDS